MVNAKHRSTGIEVAIKLLKTDLSTQIECRNILRELTILRQFSQMKENIYVSKIYDVVLAAPDPTSC